MNLSDPSSSVAGMHTADELTERELAILAFERAWWRFAGAKDEAIRDTFGMSATRYYQTLLALVRRPSAVAHDPAVVRQVLARSRRTG